MEDSRIKGAGDASVAEREAWTWVAEAQVESGVLGRVLGLVGLSFLFTAGGAAVGAALGPGIFWVSVIAAFGALVALEKLKERSPLNLGLLYAFATLEGMVVGPALDIYIARGLGGVILQAAAATATVTMAAGFFGATTRRDLSGWGSILFVGLLGVLVASVAGVFLGSAIFSTVLAAVVVALFTGFIVYDVNRAANARGASEGDTILLAVEVYLDILNIFLALLRLLGVAGSSDD